MYYLSKDLIGNGEINAMISDLLINKEPIKMEIAGYSHKLEYIFYDYLSPKPWLYDKFVLDNQDWKDLPDGIYKIIWSGFDSGIHIENGQLNISSQSIQNDFFKSEPDNTIFFKG